MAYRKLYEVVGYIYEAGYHCADCAEKRFPEISTSDEVFYLDREGNEVGWLFLGDCEPGETYGCDTCLAELDV